MMKKKVLLLGTLLFCLTGGLFAQTDNYALHFVNNGDKVVAGKNQALEGATNFSVEAWVKVDQWSQGATILSYGSAFSLKLGESGKLIAQMGNAAATVNASLTTGTWNLVTISYDGSTTGRLSAFVNATAATVSGADALPTASLNEAADLTIGTGFNGWIDEIRIWKKSLVQADIILKTTISPYNNNYASLAAYYKCDQITSLGLVDYSNSQCHGQFTPDNSLRQKVTDNAVLRYNTMTGYVSLNSLANGLLFDKGQLATCNDIALLSALKVNTKTGEAFFEYPEYPGTLTNAEFATTFTAPKTPQGDYVTNDPKLAISRVTREGILDFKGSGAQMSIKDLDLNGKKVTFNTWLYVKTWTPGAALFEKTGTDGSSISLKMGDTDGEFIFTVVGNFQGSKKTEVYPFKTSFVKAVNAGTTAPTIVTTTTGEYQYWHFLSFVFDGAQTKNPAASLAFDAFVQGWPAGGPNFVDVDTDRMTTDGVPMIKKSNVWQNKLKTLPTLDGEMLVGKGLNGYMDEISFWGIDRTRAQRQNSDALDKGLDVGAKGTYYTIQSLKAYYRVLNATDAGKDYMCFKELLPNLLRFLDGNRGYKVRLSVTGAGNNTWQSMIANADLRTKAAKNLAAAITNNPAGYPFAGLDFDFEWAENSATMDNYTLFLKELRTHMAQGSANGTLSIAVNGTMPYSCQLPAEGIALVDFFTAEDYGPFASKFTYNNYLSSQTVYAQYLQKDKMMSSIGVYAVGDNRDQINSEPYRNFANLVTGDDVERFLKPKTEYYYNFCSVNQSKKRAQYAVDNDYCGFMIYDMVCDILPTEPRSLVRAVAQAMPSNHEAIVTVANEISNPTGIEASTTDNNSELNIYVADGKMIVEAANAQTIWVSSIDGITRPVNVTEGVNEIELSQGIYIVNKQKVVVR
ncbi:MAG: LamG-like jellyroll fold domain-containing protein [Bacteroidaceae bacterium]